MEELTEQERVIVALMRGDHLSKEELAIADQQIFILGLHLKNRQRIEGVKNI